MSRTPTQANAVPRGPAWMVEELAGLRREVDELRNARRLESSSMSAGALVLKGGSVQTQDFDGDVETGTPGTAGFAIGGVTQGQAVANTLSPKNELISNDALVSPIVPATDVQANFQIKNAFAIHARAVIDVPEGFTRALVLGIGLGFGLNSSAGADFLQVQCDINGIGSGFPFGPAAAGGVVTVSDSTSTVLTGLTPGSQITVSVRLASANFDWGTSPQNGAKVDAIVLFLR